MLHTCPFFAHAQPPINDNCSVAVNIAMEPFGTQCATARIGNTTSATASTPAPKCTSTLNDDDIWYKFTAVGDGAVIRITNAVNLATGGATVIGMAVYESACPPVGNSLYCSNLASGGSGIVILTDLVAGNEYFVRFWSVLASGYASFNFCFQATQSPVNDDCAGAIEVQTEPSGSICSSGYSASTVGATASASPAGCASNFEDDDIWYSFRPGTNAVRFNFSNARSALSPSGNANLGYALYEKNCPVATVLECNGNIGVREGSVLIGGLNPGAEYLLRLYSYGTNLPATFDFCIAEVNAPPNDRCADAIPLQLDAIPSGQPTTGTLLNATATDISSAPDCFAAGNANDVWYRVAAPESGTVTVQTIPVNTRVTDLILETYTGTCANLSILSCNDDGNPDEFPADRHARIQMSGLSSGDSVYVRVIGKFSTDAGDFAIAAWNSQEQLPLQENSDCNRLYSISSGSNFGNNYWWNTFFDIDGKVVTTFNPRGQEDLFVARLGTVNAPLLLERFLLLSSSQATDSVDILFYFTDEEWLDLQSRVPSLGDPLELVIYATAPDCQVPDLLQSNIVRPKIYYPYNYQDANGLPVKAHMLLFRHPPGYAFYFGPFQEIPLPVKWGDISVLCENSNRVIEWETLLEANTKEFNVEISVDGRQFRQVGTIPAAGNTSVRTSYRFVDEAAPQTTVYYRIRQVDQDGSETISITLPSACTGTSSLKIMPNPADRHIRLSWPTTLKVEELNVIDQWGRSVFRAGSLRGHAGLEMNISAWSTGIYRLVLIGAEQRIIEQQSLLKY